MAVTSNYSPYDPPVNIFRDNDNEVWSWCDTSIRRGKNILRLQAAWNAAEVCSQILLGRDRIRRMNGLSVLTIKKLRRMLREQVAVQSNIRPRWGYKSSDQTSDLKKSIATKFTKLLDYAWTMGLLDAGFRGCTQFAGGGGTGYLMLEVDNNFNGISGNVQIAAVPLDYRQFIPFHRQEHWNIQKLFSCGIWHEMDVAEAKEKYPWAKNIIRQDRNMPSAAIRTSQTNTGYFRGVVDRWRRKRGKFIEGESPTCDIVCIYVRDKSINTSGDIIRMGEGEWEYDVPSYYSVSETPYQTNDGRYITAIETGEIGPDGQSKTRRISIEECMYYPTRREIIWCSGGIIYDGGARNLHGMLPLAQFKLDDVEGELLGFPVIMDAKSPVDTANNIFRNEEDKIHSRNNPDYGVDKSVPKDVVDALKRPKPWRSRVFQYPLSVLAKAITTIVPPEAYQADNVAIQFAQMLMDMADNLAGTKNIQNFALLKQLPASDSTESILQAMGDLPVDQSRNIERGLLSLGPIFLGLALQTYNTTRLMNILGAEAVLDFIDFNPIDLVPLDNPNDKRPRWLRAREFMQQFPFYASPQSLHERQSITQQLKRLQAKNAGVHISGREIYEVMFPEGNYGESNKLWYEEQFETLKLMAALEVYKSELQQRVQAGGLLMNALSAITNQGDKKEGRPPTNEEPAKLDTSKTDGNGVPRTVTSTSG